MHGHDESSRSRIRWVFLGFLALAALLLVAEHRAHLGGALRWLPLGVLLLCPLLHLTLHRGDAHHARAAAGDPVRRDHAVGDASSDGSAPSPGQGDR